MNKEKVITKNGSKFKILEIDDTYYFAEQSINDRIVAYEVGKLINQLDYNTREPYKSIPSGNRFGLNSIDKTFIPRMLVEATDYYAGLCNTLK
jgi:hypothetical protein